MGDTLRVFSQAPRQENVASHFIDGTTYKSAGSNDIQYHWPDHTQGMLLRVYSYSVLNVLKDGK